MTWTTKKDIENKIQKLWDNGTILKEIINPDKHFPLKIKLKTPTDTEYAEKYNETLQWKKELENSLGKFCKFKYKTKNHRILGTNEFLTHAIFENVDDAVRIIKKNKEVSNFIAVKTDIFMYFREEDSSFEEDLNLITEFLCKNAVMIFKLYNCHGTKSVHDEIKRIKSIIDWFKIHDPSGMYLRELDIPDADTKFIEQNSNSLCEFLTFVLEFIPNERKLNLEEKTFSRRFYIKEKPRLIRFKVIDKTSADFKFTDITVDIEEFKKAKINAENIFITENEINFLTFPDVKNSIIIFGRGYAVDMLKEITQLKDKKIFYFGDIDTHGFNILSTLRTFLPHTKSFLMTEEILNKHKKMWVFEEKPFLGEYKNLTFEEHALAKKLQNDFFGHGVRLEQERIEFKYIKEFADKINSL